MLNQIGPCEVKPGMVHVFLAVLQSITIVLVAWLTNRAKRKDREERERNGNGNGSH